MIGQWSEYRPLIGQHSPARRLREEEGGRSADDGAETEDEQRQDGGVAGLGDTWE